MTSTSVIMLLAGILMAWFAAGSIFNIRRGKAALRWLQSGLPLIGERTTVRWFGTTGVEMTIAKAKAPFDHATLVIFMEPRDVPWVWGPSRARGRRDTLIFRGDFDRSPAVDLEALDMSSWSGREVRGRLKEERWSEREPATAGDPRLFYKFDRAAALGDTLLSISRGAGMTVRRLSVRRGEPNLQIHVDLPSFSASGTEFFEAVRAIGEQAAKG